MYTTLSGQQAVFKQMEIIANNLANVSTAGFKAERVQFEKALKDAGFVQGSLSKDVAAPSTLSTEEFTKINGTFTDLAQGPIKITNNPFDVAVDGDGMFVVSTPEGEKYTRAGEFTLDETGRLVTHSGHAVQGSGGDIVIPGGKMQIQDSGEILVNGQFVDQIRLVEADGPLLREEGQLFTSAPGTSVSEVQNVKVVGGGLEQSNVNAVQELTNMIFASRTFEALQKSEEADGRMTRARNRVFGS